MSGVAKHDALKERLRRLPRPLLVGLDVDGTLAPIVADPAAARIPEATQQLLRKLAKREGLIVALLTGRDLPALRRMGSVAGAWRAVEHGGRIVAPGERPKARRLAPEDTAKLEAFAEWVAGTPGQLERKDGSVAIHTRKLGEAGEAWLGKAVKEAQRLGLHAREGRAVVEAELAPGDKGEALAEVHGRTGAKSVFFAGDALTDLPAIRYAARRGMGIFVKSAERPRKPKGATAAVKGPEELRALLEGLLDG